MEDLIDKGGINPYLVTALGFKTIEEAVEFFVMRRVERTLGTSFGNILEKFIIIIFGGKSGKDVNSNCKKRQVKDKSWLCWWDVVIDRPIKDGNEKWNGIVMAVKSGPANMDKDQVEHFCQKARQAEEKGYRPYLIFVYGKEAWSVITTTLKSQGFHPKRYLRIGKEVFEEFFDDSGYYKRALELFSVGGLSKDLFELIDTKKAALVKELTIKYGKNLNEFLQSTF